MGNRFLPTTVHENQLFLIFEGQTGAEGRVGLGVALGFSVGGVARWRLLFVFSETRLQDVLLPFLLHPLHFFLGNRHVVPWPQPPVAGAVVQASAAGGSIESGFSDTGPSGTGHCFQGWISGKGVRGFAPPQLLRKGRLWI